MTPRQKTLLIELCDAAINDLTWAKDWEKKELTLIKNELCSEITKKKAVGGRKRIQSR